MKNLTKFFPLISLTFPAAALAQLSSTQSLIERIGALTTSLTIVVAGIALLVFFWGLAKFIFRIGGDEKAVEEGKKTMFWGVIALFVMMSVWGLVRFIAGELLPGADFAPPPGLNESVRTIGT